MEKEFEAKNLVQFRLTGTTDGNLLVSFYQLDVFNEQAVNWHIASLLVENKMNRDVLYEGNLQNNTATADRALSTGDLQAFGAGQPVRQLCADRASKVTTLSIFVNIFRVV